MGECTVEYSPTRKLRSCDVRAEKLKVKSKAGSKEPVSKNAAAPCLSEQRSDWSEASRRRSKVFTQRRPGRPND
jgi:hypothetical protein